MCWVPLQRHQAATSIIDRPCPLATIHLFLRSQILELMPHDVPLMLLGYILYYCILHAVLYPVPKAKAWRKH